MARHSSPPKLTIVSAATVGLTLLLSACNDPATSTELATSAVAHNARDVAERLAAIASKLEAPVALSATQMSEVTENVAIDDFGAPIPYEPPGLEVGYASSVDGEALIVQVLIRGNGQTHQGLGGSARQLYGCAQFRADYGSRQISVVDIECPSWLSDWTESSELTSVTDASGKALQDVSW